MKPKKETFLWDRILFLMVFATVALLSFPAFGADPLKEVASLSANGKSNGDFRQMVRNRSIRVLIPYSKTFYFLDGATQRGATYEMVKEFENAVNTQLESRLLQVHVIIIPTSRERLLPDLIDGLGDIAAGNLTISDHRIQSVDFSDPFIKNISEVLVTGSKPQTFKDISELSGQEIYVRKSSSYHESILQVNKALVAAGKAKIRIIQANDNLEDEDLLEMVDAGLIPMMVIDSHKGQFWARIFENITLHPNITFRENAMVGWAIRKNSPELKKVINDFVKSRKKGTLLGNIIFNRYLKNTSHIQNNLTGKARKRFEETIDLFRKYGELYKIDWLALAALAYQESTIDQSRRSHAGAIGVMQILPTTASDRNVNIPNIGELEPNIHAGTKYLRFMMDRYFNDPSIDTLNRALLTIAAYNAGPARIIKLRKEAKSMNLDPNVWFKNVEVVAARRIGRETVQYVSNIFKYYIAYTFVARQEKAKRKQLQTLMEKPFPSMVE